MGIARQAKTVQSVLQPRGKDLLSNCQSGETYTIHSLFVYRADVGRVNEGCRSISKQASHIHPQKVDQFQSLGTLAPRLSPMPIFPFPNTLPILVSLPAQLTVGVDGSSPCELSLLLLLLLAICHPRKSRQQCSHARERVPLGW